MVKDEIISTYDINPNKIHIIYNGIEFKILIIKNRLRNYLKNFDLFHTNLLFCLLEVDLKGKE